MSSPYAGNPANFPDDFPIPDDADPSTAAAFNPAIEALGDRTAFLHANLHSIGVEDVTVSGNVTVPEWATHVYFEGCGGGGGGGGGCRAAGADRNSVGGGGGGGALLTSGVLAVTGGETLAVVIGSGGPGGDGGAGVGGVFPAGTAPEIGSNGDDTTIERVSTTTIIASLRGAQGGDRGRDDAANNFVTFNDDPATPQYSVCEGGRSVRPGWTRGTNGGVNTIDASAMKHHAPSSGGRGASKNSASDFGNASQQGFVGGAPGADGADSSSSRGGGGGGGAGAGPFGEGGDGGDGGNGNNAGPGFPGGDGDDALSNTGAGGGGGGASGATPNSGAADGQGGNGGNGGSGRLTLVFLRGPL